MSMCTARYSVGLSSLGLVLLMLIQGTTGVLLRGQYRDPAWITATWFGNDWVTIGIGAPLLAIGIVWARKGSARGVLLWLGTVGYAAYNYAFYLFGAALNAFFLTYVVAVVLAGGILIVALSNLDVATLSRCFRPSTPVRMIAAVLVLVGAGLAAVWTAMWAAYVFADTPTPVEPEAFKVVAALDMVLMVPALMAGGVLLWRREPWGFVVAAIASLQGALYLLVLSVNATVAIQTGSIAGPGELPIWGTLAVVMAATAGTLLANVQEGAAVRLPALRRGGRNPQSVLKIP